MIVLYWRGQTHGIENWRLGQLSSGWLTHLVTITGSRSLPAEFHDRAGRHLRIPRGGSGALANLAKISPDFAGNLTLNAVAFRGNREGREQTCQGCLAGIRWQYRRDSKSASQAVEFCRSGGPKPR